MPYPARAGARAWPPRPHAFPVTFNLGKETTGLLKGIKVQLLPYYQEILDKHRGNRKSGKSHWVCDHVEQFDISFYVPHDAMQIPDNRLDHIVIMVNGLNEIDHIHYAHYDRLGAALAFRGLGAALYPTPFHLNRTPYIDRRFEGMYRQFPRPKDNPKPLQKWPEAPGAMTMSRRPHCGMMRHPGAIFHCFEQTSRDLVQLAKTIQGSASASGAGAEYDQLFYDYLFDRTRRPHVSLLGYSLGGLQVLYTFLKEPELFDHCILVNSGANLKGIRTKPVGIRDNEWDTIVRNAINLRNEIPDSIAAPHRTILDQVLFNRPFEPGEANTTLLKNLGKLLFIAGGADIVSPGEFLARFVDPSQLPADDDFSGLNILQIAGLGHPLAKSTVYDRWFPAIVNTIERFLRSPARNAVSYEDVLRHLAGYTIHRIPWDKWVDKVQCVDDIDKTLDVLKVLDRIRPIHRRRAYKAEFLRHYLVSKRYFENDSELLRTLERERRRKGIKR